MGISILLLALIILIIASGWRVLNWAWLRPRKLERLLRQQGFKGNPFRFPFGDLRESSRMDRDARSRTIGLYDDILPRVDPFFHHTVKNYGKDSFIWVGPTPKVNITNPDHIKELFSKMHDFHKTHSHPAVRTLVGGLVYQEGEKWAVQRKIMNPPFQVEKLKLILPEFSSCCNEMVTRWEKLVSSTDERHEIDAWTDIENLTRDIVSRAAFGSSFEEGKRIFELQKEQVKLAMSSIHTLSIPGWRFLPTKTDRRIKKINKEVESLVHEIISKREKAMKAGEAANDLLGLLQESNLKAIREHKGNQNNTGLSIEDIIEECKQLHFAGQVPTSILLGWTMLLLSIHPEWQNRAREEVLQVFGRNKPEFDGLNRLKIITMIVYEVLRLYPPAVALSRRVDKETKLGTLTIPAGVQLYVPTILVHHDPQFWGNDAKEFKPERFAEGLSKATNNSLSFFPFGYGPRMCIGQNFALFEVKIALAMILQRFSFELSPSYAHAPGLYLVQPQHGIQVFLHKYPA